VKLQCDAFLSACAKDEDMTDVADGQRILCQIANCAFEIVGRLLERDQLLAESLRSTETNSRQIFREESITLEMVATLKERFPNHVDVTVFTAAEETRNGADWYWRFQKANHAIHARVQAKRVQRSAFGQPDSSGTVEIDIDQLQRLIATAELDQVQLPGLQSWLATYARYDATPPCNREPTDCSKHGCGGNCAGQPRIPSVWITKAQELVDSPHSRQTRRIRDIVQNSIRLDCVLPCIDIDPSNATGPNAKGLVLSANLPPYEKCVASIERNPAMGDTLRGALQIRL
jgi:hypothetical protein